MLPDVSEVWVTFFFLLSCLHGTELSLIHSFPYRLHAGTNRGGHTGPEFRLYDTQGITDSPTALAAIALTAVKQSSLLTCTTPFSNFFTMAANHPQPICHATISWW